MTQDMRNADEGLATRGARLSRIAAGALRYESRLVKVLAFPAPTLSRLQNSVAVYLWHSLAQAHPDRAFTLSPRVLEDYGADVLALPNRTPNGLVLPRCETFISFNLVQQALASAIAELRLDEPFEAFQSPCNIRVVSSAASANADSRPYASSKIHTDVWYGEPVGSILFNLPLLGDASAVGMDFLEPEEFPVRLRAVLDDYNQGGDVAGRAQRLTMPFECGLLYVSDSLSLHQTMRRGEGIRLSLDWRALPREKLAGEVGEKVRSRAVYVPTERFLAGGSRLVFADGDPLDGFQRRERGEAVSPARIELVPVGAS